MGIGRMRLVEPPYLFPSMLWGFPIQWARWLLPVVRGVPRKNADWRPVSVNHFDSGTVSASKGDVRHEMFTSFVNPDSQVSRKPVSRYMTAPRLAR